MMFSATRAAMLSAVLTGVLLVDSAAAQCATCPQPTVVLSPVVQAPVVQAPVAQVAYRPVTQVAYSPVVTTQPVVLQSYPPVRPIFSGRLLRRIFGYPEPVVVAPAVATPGATFVTAAYQPTYPLTTGYVTPAVQTVARPVALTTTTFRPVAIAPTCCPAPNCCPACTTGGVTTASFNTPVSSCPNCAGGSSTFTQPFTPPAASPSPTPAGETPQPGLAPNAAVPEQRLRPLPGNSVLNSSNPTSPASPASDDDTQPTFDFGDDSDAYWQAPQLFNPNARTTRRPAAPVWNAVYQQDRAATAFRQTTYQVGPEAAAPAPRRQQQGASGWRSVGG